MLPLLTHGEYIARLGKQDYYMSIRQKDRDSEYLDARWAALSFLALSARDDIAWTSCERGTYERCTGYWPAPGARDA